jgi:biotin-[acetyl-CoA-carboxylase] ligase BirA-like protein
MKLKNFESLDSTQDQVRREFLEDSSLKTVAVLSKKQKKGRGSRGRKWQNGNGESFLLSLGFFWRKTWNPDLKTFQSLIAGLAVYRVLKQKKLFLKWPNDLIAHRKKVGGILVERPSGFDGKLWIVGIGINFNRSPKSIARAGALKKTLEFEALTLLIWKEIQKLNRLKTHSLLNELRRAMNGFWGCQTLGGTWSAMGLTEQGSLIVWNFKRQRFEEQHQTRRRFVL